jgi:hypothetical protein
MSITKSRCSKSKRESLSKRNLSKRGKEIPTTY